MTDQIIRRNASMTILQWCAHRKISRAMFYKLTLNGQGPKTFMVGSKRFVSEEADAAWLAQREAESISA